MLKSPLVRGCSNAARHLTSRRISWHGGYIAHSPPFARSGAISASRRGRSRSGWRSSWVSRPRNANCSSPWRAVARRRVASRLQQQAWSRCTRYSRFQPRRSSGATTVREDVASVARPELPVDHRHRTGRSRQDASRSRNGAQPGLSRLVSSRRDAPARHLSLRALLVVVRYVRLAARRYGARSC